MTTAREKLYEEMVAIIAQPAGPSADGEMRKLMSRYRVQTKPGVDVPPGVTARDALGERLLELWRTLPPDVKPKIGAAIDEFRMQLKATSSPPQPAARPSLPPRPAFDRSDLPRIDPRTGRPMVPAVEDEDGASTSPPGFSSPLDRRPLAASSNPSSPSAPHAPHASAGAPGASQPPSAPVSADPVSSPGLRRPGRATAEPVAGGPRKRGRTRGECPKCHSMGVVLARSYSGDEYFSCIYCGWQAYKPTEEDDPNASLAVRLLGQTAPENQRE